MVSLSDSTEHVTKSMESFPKMTENVNHGKIKYREGVKNALINYVSAKEYNVDRYLAQNINDFQTKSSSSEKRKRSKNVKSARCGRLINECTVKRESKRIYIIF